VDVPATLAAQLQALSGCSHDLGVALPQHTADGAPAGQVPDGELTVELGRLGRAVLAAVPSCLAVTIAVTRLGVDVPLTVLAADATRDHVSVPVLASLAVPLPAAGFGGILVLQASAPGAFQLLAADLGKSWGSDRPRVRLDEHLRIPPASTGATVAAVLVELQRLNRALGVLIGQGWLPEAGERELHRRAAATGTTVAAVSDRLLRSPVPGAGPGTD
jgi:hypothetical protein